MALTLAQITLQIAGHCVPTRNAITRVMLSLREGARWGVVGWGGCMIFVSLLFVNQVRDVCQKKYRENVGILPPPPCLGTPCL